MYINNESSNLENISVGVAQGSLLGVLLFKLYINDIHTSLRYCNSILYADDTTIFVVGKYLRFLRTKMQFDLDKLYEWLKVNRLKLNVAKTKSMVFSREGLNPNVELIIDKQYIETVSSFKFLGVIFD